MRKLTKQELASNQMRLSLFVTTMRLERIGSAFSGLTASLQQFNHLVGGMQYASETQGKDTTRNFG